MAIPKFKKEYVIEALKFIDENGVPFHNQSTKYELVNDDGKRYPPKYVVAVACSSLYGDYFTGGIGSVLYLDQFELIYDPAELTEDEYEKVFSKVGQI